MTIPRYYTVPRAAVLLHVHPQTLRREVRRGAISTTKLGKRKMVSECAIAAYLTRNTEPVNEATS